MEINEAVIGKVVIYTPYTNCSPDLKERGVITNVTEKYVFVRYGNELQSKATNVSDLEYEL
jgi:hypothetical protein